MYSWVALDQEINLFHDRQPELDFMEIHATLPSTDELWNATSVEDWQNRVAKTTQFFQPTSDPRGSLRSLANLYTMFMSGELADESVILSLTELRFLLHPVQSMIHHLNKSVGYFYNPKNPRPLQRLLTQLDEVQYVLKQWHDIATRVLASTSNTAEHVCSTMILFHLTSLNAIVYFPDIERLSRREISVEQFRGSLWAGKRCADEELQVWTHCGQIIRYFRQMPASRRPHWWSASIYRASLIMWATSLVIKADHSSRTNASPGRETIAVDAFPYDHPSIVRYLRHQDEIPVLSRSDGTLVTLDAPDDVTIHCINVLGEVGPRSDFDEGIIARLSALSEQWRS